MKFLEKRIDNKIKSFEYVKRSFFNKIKERIVFTNIENDTYLSKELSFLGEDKIKNSVFLERGNVSLKKIKSFKEKKYIITYINRNELKEFVDNGFLYIKDSPNSCYDYCVWREI